jgi:hypothetical protein
MSRHNKISKKGTMSRIIEVYHVSFGLSEPDKVLCKLDFNVPFVSV